MSNTRLSNRAELILYTATSSIDEILQTRAQKLKARRSEVLTEMAKLRDRQALAVRRVNADTVKAFPD